MPLYILVKCTLYISLNYNAANEKKKSGHQWFSVSYGIEYRLVIFSEEGC